MPRTIAPARNVLASFYYFREFDLDTVANLAIIGDSGAFSAASQGAQISVDELAEWARRWERRLDWCASLDVIGDADATRANWRRAVDRHGLRAIPTVHFGADPSTMDYYAERGVDLIGLGGLVGRAEKPGLRWLVAMFKYARAHHPHVRFHGWGATRVSWLRLPFYSVDSSSWTSPARYGRMLLRDPRGRDDIQVRLNGRDVYQPVAARLLRDAYGLSPAYVAESSGANRDVILRLSALTAAVQEHRFSKMHGPITAPRWPGPGLADGPRMHLVVSSNGGSNTAIGDVDEIGGGG